MKKNDDYINAEVVEDDTKSSSALLLPESIKPERLNIIPIFGRPYFPAQVQPLVVSQKKWIDTIKRVKDTDHQMLGLCFVDKKPQGNISAEDLAKTGCVVRIHNVVNGKDNIQFVAEGIQRFKIKNFISDKFSITAIVEYLKDTDTDHKKIKAYALAIINAIKELLPLNPLYGEGLKDYLARFTPQQPSPLADFASTLTTAEGNELQTILETLSVVKRLEKVLVLLKKELETVKLQGEISDEVNRKMSENQRKFFLKEQLKVIQKELGLSKDDKTADIDQFKERLEELTVPDHVQEKIDEEFEKISILETGSPEYGVSRNYLDWITSIPWGYYSEDRLEIDAAKKTLDKDHSGLEDVKDHILEFLALGVYKGEVSGSIMLLVGPPGVGKTSIGKSVADALGRKFYRFSLGGMRDEAEIKGHRRTYIGAMPGKFIQALRRTGVSNPVIMLDEIDKVGSSFQGDPASALLEVLDPEQNIAFNDHYLDLEIDLSKILFICTANQLDTIPAPLLDRMDITRLPGYITAEKVEIAKKHLWPDLLKRNKIKSKQIKITDAAIRNITDGYAREAGVRGLEKQLRRILRKAVVNMLKDKDLVTKINVSNIAEYLGPKVFTKDKKITGVGVVTGLAWTSMGGATLSVEATRVHEKNYGFKLTGQLGDVMKESAEIAFSYISSNIQKFGGKTSYFDKAFIHLHVPEGATPKDGPSAGVTMATALLSLALGKKPTRPIAMTGELSLTGKVLPVGGIREKIIAARRSGIMEVILPEDNRRNVEELPDYIKKGFTVHFADTYKDVYKIIDL